MCPFSKLDFTSEGQGKEGVGGGAAAGQHAAGQLWSFKAEFLIYAHDVLGIKGTSIKSSSFADTITQRTLMYVFHGSGAVAAPLLPAPRGAA